MRNPTPGIKCRLRRGYRFGIQNLFRIHTNPFCLLHDEMKMAVLRILVLNDFAKLVLKNFLLDRHHRAVGRNVGPAVATVADVEAELRDHQLRPALVHLDRKIVLQFRRAHVVSHHLAYNVPPLRDLH